MWLISTLDYKEISLNQEPVKEGIPMPNGDTFNVSSHGQQGGITAGQVNFGRQPRFLDEAAKRTITTGLPNRSIPITVIATMGDGESIQFGQTILNFLRSNGYTVDGVNQAVWNGSFPGTQIDTSTTPIQIKIGFNQ
jgi:hypothetical protein